MFEESHMSALNRRLVALGVPVGLAGAMLAVAWAGEPCPTQCASGKVPLGVVAPMTGSAASFGGPAAKAIEIGVRDLNAGGGLLGVPVQALIEDDRCDGGMAVAAAKHQIERNKVSFVIGPICPAGVMDATPFFAKAGVVQFVPTATMVALTRKYADTVFRLAATDEQEAQALVAYVGRAPKGTKLAVVYSDFSFRREMAQMIKQALTGDLKASARFEPLLDVPGSYDRLADKLQRDPPDVLYMALDGDRVSEFVAALRQRGVKCRLIGGQQLLSQRFWGDAREAAEGIHFIAPIGPMNDPEVAKAVDLFGRSKVTPDLVTLNSYAAVQVWAEAVRRAGVGEPKKVVEALRSGEFKTGAGRVAYDQKGDRRDISYSALTWQGGRLISTAEWRQ